jgi:8-oxo-dGTP diphosphatase
MITSASTPSTAPDRSVTSVAVGILQDAQHRVLVARRPKQSHQGGKWEFPGGKIQPGESVPDALARELREELGIGVLVSRPLLRVVHHYSDKSVLLDVWRVLDHIGEPHGCEGQPLQWVTRGELQDLELPEADQPILRALDLPPLYVISDATRYGIAESLNRLERMLHAGARLVQLREPAMPPVEYRSLARKVVSMARDHGARVLLNADPSWVEECGADGVHLNSNRLMALERRPLAARYLVAASCHDEAELRKAARIGADFSVLSPVHATRSHPAAVPLGWREFARLRMAADIPVYALGGLLADDLNEARLAGATGLAMIRGIWDAGAIDETVGKLLA